MTKDTSEKLVDNIDNSSMTYMQKICRNILHKHFRKIEYGTLVFQDPLGSIKIQGSKESHKVAKININDLRCYPLIVFGGALGAGKAYILNLWKSDDLIAVLRLMLSNRHVLDNLEKGFAWFNRPQAVINKIVTQNTLKGIKQNIKEHYDLSNDLFEQFLDPTMMYSSALFKSEDDTLEQASLNKLARICEIGEIKSSDHVLEIGSGWGGFAVYVAKHFGCKVTTTTISDQQFDYVAKLIKKEGLEQQITLLKKDYRKLEGKYDKIISIEMIEAVGQELLSNYIHKCDELLEDDGVLVLQAITINDQVYDRAVEEVDFIKKYIFPGSFIPSVFEILKAAKEQTTLRLYSLDDITQHYALTLRRWRDSFFAKQSKIIELGFDSSFIRMWDYYFCYCIAGFEERAIGDVHLKFAKSKYKNAL